MREDTFPRTASLGPLGEVPRLGLATRGNTKLEPEDVEEAIRRGVRYFNWCGYPDGLSKAVRRLGPRRREIVVAAQVEARTAEGARRELRELLGELGTEYLDAVTYYYLEHEEEWEAVHRPGGAREAFDEAIANGRLRAVGITTHQRRLARRAAVEGTVDFLMIRYNAAHTGAEEEVFPEALRRGVPAVAYTALRWGALLQPTPDDPPGFRPPSAPDCYRFALSHPAVSVVLMAPNGRRELEEDLALLDDWRPVTAEERKALLEHGRRVRRHGGAFP